MHHDTPTAAATARLSHPDPSERMAALEDLCLAGDPAALIRAAGALLADRDPAVRELAGRHLAQIGTTEAAAQACPYIASPDIGVRNLAGDVLTRIGAPAVPVLAAAIDDPDKDVRKFAIDVLALLPAWELSHRIAARLTDEDANVRLAAIDALGALQATEHQDALLALYEPEPLARPSIVAAMGRFARAGAGVDLAFFGRALADEDPVVQLAAAEALADLDDPSLIDLLIEKAHHVDPMARPVLLHALVRLLEVYPDHTAALPPSLRTHFLDMLADVDLTYVVSAVKGLRLLDAEGTLPDVLAHAGRDDALDVEIFHTLLAVPAPLRPLADAVDRQVLPPDPAAQLALGLIMQQALAPEDLPEAAALLVDHFDALDAETKIAALNLCLHLNEEALFGLVEAGLRDPDPTVQDFASDAAQDLGLAPSY
ncbi:hypothetical protein AWN76_017525 [Rhodothermaceae bacterium RA]|nr:hypothetical protein AWN76_017525 [Rhodothermaceae bacterium RA]